MTANAAKTTARSGNQVRETFLRFFESKGHRRLRSSSLVPHGDSTLLFTNAGMNQFKDVFLGLEKRDYTRATTAQKCVRAGGKHNDLENVGFTKRHHTFFEMLGNFSFGDYFKMDAIAYAWELVTSPEWYGIDREELYVTVFGGAEVASGSRLGADEEARNFWLAQNVPAARIVPIPGLKDNFWAMGDTGPCGPCSEIHYDMGPAASEEGHADCRFPCDCGRYVEIWNLVFMQFNRDAAGTLVPLPKPCVDTGMGLERVAAVLEGVISNYDTDLFTPLLDLAARLTGTAYRQDPKVDASLRVIADHSRAATFLVSDGVVPSNEGRGYVLRKILRRALRHADALFKDRPVSILEAMSAAVAAEMKGAYPELAASEGPTGKVLAAEEERFYSAISRGLTEFYSDLVDMAVKSGAAAREIRDELAGLNGFDRRRRAVEVIKSSASTIVYPGERAFRLYDTFGLPADFISDVCRDLGIQYEEAGFQLAMEEQKRKARASWKGTHKEAASPAYAKIAETYKTEPGFYYGTHAKDCRIEAILASGPDPRKGPVPELAAGESGEVVLDRTAIYAESGGQISDTGALLDNSGSELLAEVSGAYYPVAGLVAHRVTARETLRVGDRVTVVADAERRSRVMRNHSGTHLVHAALRNILGTQVKQAGSLNAADRLRFDFSHFAPVDAYELRDIEQQVNEKIRLNTEIETSVTSLDEALVSGALAFFGDKYPEHNVRVVTIPDPHAPRGFYSKELCGGTHVKRVGDIGVLKIIGEESVAAGVRRIEAVTGAGALEHYQQQANLLSAAAKQLNVGEDAVLSSIEKLAHTSRQLEKQLAEQRRKGALNRLDELLAGGQTVKGTRVVVGQVENLDREALRQLVDSLRQKMGSGVVVLGQAEDGRVTLIAGVTKDLTAKVHAGKVIQTLAKQVGGTGGGRPDLAEAGGKDTNALNSTLGGVPALLEPLL
jgi:alanyl-tRNA synthetase